MKKSPRILALLLVIFSLIAPQIAQAAKIQPTDLEAVRLVVPSDSDDATKEIRFTLDEALDTSTTLPSEITVTIDIPKDLSKIVSVSPKSFTIPINTTTGEAGSSDPVEFSLKDSVSYNYKVKPSKALEKLGIETEKGTITLDLTSSSSSSSASTAAAPDSVTLGVPAGSAASTESITVTIDDPSGTETPSSGRVKLILGKNAGEVFRISPHLTDIPIDSVGKPGDSEEIVFTLRRKMNFYFRVLPDASAEDLGVVKSRKLIVVIDADGEST